MTDRRLTKVSFWIEQKPSPEPTLHEFTLGLGPCGEVVTGLKSWVEGNRLIIIQDCEDGSRQFFDYPSRLIQSRIRRDYEAV